MDLFLCVEGLVLGTFVRVHGFVLRSFRVFSNASGCPRLCLQSRPAALPVGGGLRSCCSTRVAADSEPHLNDPSGRQRIVEIAFPVSFCLRLFQVCVDQLTVATTLRVYSWPTSPVVVQTYSQQFEVLGAAAGASSKLPCPQSSSGTRRRGPWTVSAGKMPRFPPN